MATATSSKIAAGGRSTNAFIGPFSFPPDRRIYGRDRELLALSYRLLSERLVLMYSPSGAGKTSLLMAKNGIRDRMAGEGMFCLPSIRVSHAANIAARHEVNRYLLSTLVALEETRPVRRTAEELAELLKSRHTDGGFLHRFIRDLASECGESPDSGGEDPADSPQSIFLVLDQFEELLTLDRTDQAAKLQFCEQLGTALRDGQIWALFAMREDHVAALDPLLPKFPSRLAASFRLDLLDRSAARLAAEQPPAEFGVAFDQAALNRLEVDLSTINVPDPETGLPQPKAGNYVEPLHLQVFCYRLWKVRQEPARIAIEDFDRVRYPAGSLTGISAALAGYYDDAVAEVAADAVEQRLGFANPRVAERFIRKWFSRALISSTGIRLPVPAGAEADCGLTPPVVKLLIDRFLIRSDQRHSLTYYELAHDRLIEPVQTSNAAYRSRLSAFQRQATLYHDAPESQRPDLLVAGEVLQQGISKAASNDGEFTPDDRAFLKSCLQARWRRLTVWLGASAAAVLLGGIALVTYVYVTERLSRARQAEHDQQVLAAFQLTLEAQAALADDPRASYLKGSKASETFTKYASSGIPEELRALLAKAEANQSMQVLGSKAEDGSGPPARHKAPISQLVPVTQPMNWLISHSDDLTTLLWKDPFTAAAAPREPAPSPGIPVTAIAVTSDGRHCLLGHKNGMVCNWYLSERPSNGSSAGKASSYDILVPASEVRVTALAASQSDPDVVAVALSNEIVLYNIQTKQRLNQGDPRGSPQLVNQLVLLDDRHVVVGKTGSLECWDMQDSKTVPRWQYDFESGGYVGQIVLAPRQNVLAFTQTALGDDNESATRLHLLQIHAPNRRPQQLATTNVDEPMHLELADPLPNTATPLRVALATTNYGGQVYMLQRDRQLTLVELKNLSSVTAVSFSATGRELLAGTLEGKTLLWEKLEDPTADPVEFATSSSTVSAVCAANGFIFAGAMDGTIRRWERALQGNAARIEKQLEWENNQRMMQQSAR